MPRYRVPYRAVVDSEEIVTAESPGQAKLEIVRDWEFRVGDPADLDIRVRVEDIVEVRP